MFTALGLFHAVWRDMEILLKNTDIEEDNLLRLQNENYDRSDKNDNDNVNIDKSENYVNVNINNYNDDDKNTDIKTMKSIINEKIVILPTSKNVPRLSLSHSFGVALERSSTELSEAEIFQVIFLNIFVLHKHHKQCDSVLNYLFIESFFINPINHF